MAKVELKQPIVEEIKASLDGAKGVVLVDHRGLTVEQDTVLRKSLVLLIRYIRTHWLSVQSRALSSRA